MAATAPNWIPSNLVGYMPRRNVLIPTACLVLLFTVWTIRLPQSPIPWPGSQGAHMPGHAGPGAGPGDHAPPPTSASPASHGLDLSDPEAPFIGWPLQRVCEETTYVEGLTFVCDNNSGGVGNIRNYIQTCLRYALEAGATALVVPRIRARDVDDLSNLNVGKDEYRPFSYMFDEDHFKSAFKTNCPKIAIYDNVESIPNVVKQPGERPHIQEIVPKDFGSRKGCDFKDQNRHTDQFGLKFRKWLQDASKGRPPSKQEPRLIRFKWGVLWDWPIYRDGPEFANTFGHVLKYNAELLRLGKTALKNMHGLARSKGAPKGEFLGVHLRSENDALSFWPTYEAQIEGYVAKALEQKYKAAYLATGNVTEAQKFVAEASAKANMQVVTKTDLFSPKDLETLAGLSWDQQAMVDSVVLMGSTYFMGVMPSSFSVYTAMRRHLRTGGLYTRPYKTGTDGDGLSYIVGSFEMYWEDWLFMWDGMWP